jgi:hypothetical protein
MKVILGITNELNIALQKKDQDIVNAVSYLGTTKRRLQEMRNDYYVLLPSYDEFNEFNVALQLG